MSVTIEILPGCVPPVDGTGRVYVARVDDLWLASWQGGLDQPGSNQCMDAWCTSEAEAVEWALSQSAAEWMVRHDENSGVWEPLR